MEEFPARKLFLRILREAGIPEELVQKIRVRANMFGGYAISTSWRDNPILWANIDAKDPHVAAHEAGHALVYLKEALRYGSMKKATIELAKKWGIPWDYLPAGESVATLFDAIYGGFVPERSLNSKYDFIHYAKLRKTLLHLIRATLGKKLPDKSEVKEMLLKRGRRYPIASSEEHEIIEKLVGIHGLGYILAPGIEEKLKKRFAERIRRAESYEDILRTVEWLLLSMPARIRWAKNLEEGMRWLFRKELEE